MFHPIPNCRHKLKAGIRMFQIHVGQLVTLGLWVINGTNKKNALVTKALEWNSTIDVLGIAHRKTYSTITLVLI